MRQSVSRITEWSHPIIPIWRDWKRPWPISIRWADLPIRFLGKNQAALDAALGQAAAQQAQAEEARLLLTTSLSRVYFASAPCRGKSRLHVI